MRVLSLFDGIGVAYYALTLAGCQVDEYLASEIDAPAIAVARRHNPIYKDAGDVKQIADPPQGLDLLIGGSPCQSLSIAKIGIKDGLREGQSVLFWEYVRVLKGARPHYFILENVASMKRQAEQEMTAALFGVEPTMINSASVSAQHRRRLYWVGVRDGAGYRTVTIPRPKDRGIILRDILQRPDQVPDRYHMNPDFYMTIDRRPPGPGLFTDDAGHTRPIKIGYRYKNQHGEVIPKSKLEKSGRQDEQVYDPKGKSIGVNTTCPPIIQVGQAHRVYDTSGKSVTLVANGGGGGAKTGLYKTSTGRQNEGVYCSDGKACSLTNRGIGLETAIKQDGIRRLTPTECERLQTLPDDYTVGHVDTQRYKMLGNAFTAEVIAHIIREIRK